MKEQTIRLSENQLKDIVKETVRTVLNEAEGNGINVYAALLDAAEKFELIKESGLIAFTSPNPSSTEQELKDCVQKALSLTYKATSLYSQLYKRQY